jgi:hypothetical protein
MASYPGGYPTFSTKVDGVTTVVAADPNLIQDEVLAIENILGTNPHQSTLASVGSYVSNPTSTTFGTVTARVANIEAGLVSSISSGNTNASNISSLTTRVGTAETNITSLTSRMTAAEGVNTTQTSNISTNTTNISSLTTRMTAAETTLAGVATDANLTTLANRVTAVEGVNTTQTSNISTNTSDISTINSTLSGFTTSITTGALTTSSSSSSTPVGLTITQSSNANSKRASIQIGSGWLIGQDSSAVTSGGLKDFFIYDSTASTYRLKIGTNGTVTIGSLEPTTITKISVAASSGTYPPIKLTTGTLVSAQTTSATNGSFEYDGKVGYFSPVSAVNGRALLSTPFYYANSATRTLSATTTAAQAIFGPDSGDGVGLTLGSFSTYEFEIVGSVLATTTVSTNVTLRLSHTSYTLLAYHGTYGINQTSPTIIQKQSTSGDVDLVIGAVNTTTARPIFSIKGIIRTNTSQASFIPYVVLSAASSGSGNFAVSPGSYIKITPLGDNNVTEIGFWQ